MYVKERLAIYYSLLKRSPRYGMSDGDDEEREEEFAAPAAAAESDGDGAGQPAAGGAAVDA
jgi:hypothetical protein